MRARRLLLPWLLLTVISPVALRAAEAPSPAAVLRVGVLDGAQPCSDLENGHWQGLAVNLWSNLASRERLPYLLEARPSAAALLASVQRHELDVGIGCLTITPERVNSVRFSLPFQEMGLAVLQRRSRLEAGQAVLRSLLSQELLQLLAVYLLSIGVVSVLLWRIEGHGQGETPPRLGQRRHWAKVFQILATGPGTNTIASTTRGHALVIVSYLIRIVTASLLVTTITVKVVRDPLQGAIEPQNLNDLQGLRVAARPGSVSEQVLRGLNSRANAEPIEIVPLPQITQAATLLLEGQADAVLAEEQQLQFVLDRHPRRGLVISLQGVQRQSQAFVLSPRLPAATVARINHGLSQLKRSGVVMTLQREAVNKS